MKKSKTDQTVRERKEWFRRETSTSQMGKSLQSRWSANVVKIKTMKLNHARYAGLLSCQIITQTVDNMDSSAYS